MVNLVYTFNSITDLKSIHDFISKDSPANARRFVFDLRKHLAVLKTHPEFGFPAYPDRYQKIRQVLFKSYRIIYLLQEGTIFIITVFHQHRLPENIPSLSQFEK